MGSGRIPSGTPEIACDLGMSRLLSGAGEQCSSGLWGETTDFIPVVPEGGTGKATRRQISTLYKEELSNPLELFKSKWVAC